jgi:transmembrane sensor
LLVTGTLVVYLLAPRGVYATTLGEQRSLALNDGSTVQLNSLSKIRIRYSQYERTVDLVEGQALFHVAKDSTRPFIVYSGQTRVRAVGTQFDVYRKADGIVVTVVEGRVAVLPASSPLSGRGGRKGDSKLAVDSGYAAARREGENSNASASHTNEGHPSKPMHEGEQVQPNSASTPDDGRPDAGSGTAIPEGAIFVAAGEQITVTPQAAHKTSHPNVTGATAWTERRLVFDSASLTDVADEFNRYNERKLVIAPSALGGFHISGVFSSTDPASLIRFLRDRPGLRVIETPNEIRIEKDL